MVRWPTTSRSLPRPIPHAGHKGMSCFIVERAFGGVTTSKPLEKMGQHAAQTSMVFFEDVEVPAETCWAAKGRAS